MKKNQPQIDGLAQSIKKRIEEILKQRDGQQGNRANNDEGNRRNISYQKSYDAIRRWCDMQRGHWTEDTCILLAHIVYGWMPGILTLGSGKKQLSIENIIGKDARIIASLLNHDDFLSPDTASKQIGKLKAFVNNSLVGASKFLHFIYPDYYAMWDSNVIGAIGKVVPYIKGSGKKKLDIDSIDHFLVYQKAIRDYAGKKKSLREIEWKVFEAGQRQKAKATKAKSEAKSKTGTAKNAAPAKKAETKKTVSVKKTTGKKAEQRNSETK